MRAFVCEQGVYGFETGKAKVCKQKQDKKETIRLALY